VNAHIPTGRTIARIAVPLRPGSPAAEALLAKGQRPWVRRSPETRDPATVRRMQAMVQELGRRGVGAWDLLERVTSHQWSLLELYERYARHRGDLDAIRREADDRAIADLVPGYLAHVRANTRPGSDTADHYEVYLEALQASGFAHVSDLTTPRLSRWLNARAGAAGTRRKYAAGISGFCRWLILEELLAVNPMREVQKPKLTAPRISFLPEPVFRGIIDAMPSPYRELSAFIHGTGLDVSAALAIEVGAIDLATWGVTHIRPKTERVHSLLISDWARPAVRELVRGKLPLARIGDGISRWALSDAHRDAAKAKGHAGYQLRHARHSWTVRFLRLGGTPAQAAEQLGHNDGGVLVLTRYGRYVPSLAERQAVEDRAREAR
jgi:integrase